MIEIIATTIEDAIRIDKYGGDRIELVSALTEGGLTPSYSLIKNVVKNVSIPVNVMIRPHAKSFIYSKEEIKLMKEDIIIAKELKANGVVLGVLSTENKICEEALIELLEVCDGLDVTFHKAIDELSDPVLGTQILSKYPQIKTVLTSGGIGKILDNAEIIRAMGEKSGHVDILIGGGLTIENIGDIIKKGITSEYHFGTAVRENNSCFGEIAKDKLTRLVQIIKKCDGRNMDEILYL